MTRPYQHSFFGCCSPFDRCLKLEATFCPCILYGKNRYRNAHGTDVGADSCNAYCCGYFALCWCGHLGWILQCLTRQDVQEKNNLEGNACGNCMGSWCCYCCELTQTSKELDYIQLSQGNTANGYKTNEGMVAQPPK